jgi:putative ABC transport system substrate-binding protein
MKKKAVALIIFAIVLIGILILTSREKAGHQFRIAIVSIVEIEPIKQLREGFRDAFDQSDFVKSHQVGYSYYNAQNDASLINQIVDKLAADKPNLIYVLGTPIAQAIQRRIPDVLLDQGAVTDPVSAGLANSWNGSGKNYIATTDLPPVGKQIELIRTLTPYVRKLGIIYNPGEVNSVAVVSRIRDYIKNNKVNIQLIERPISNTSDVAMAAQSLAGDADAVYLPPDNTVYAAIPVVGRFCKDQRLPLYASVASALKDGALATLSLDYKTLGEGSALLALKVLNGADPKTLPIQMNENPAITVSKRVADSFSIDESRYEHLPNVKIIE